MLLANLEQSEEMTELPWGMEGPRGQGIRINMD